MNGQPLSADENLAISRLPSREVLIGRLVGMVASPLTGLAAAMDNLISGLARQLAQLAEQGLVGQDAPAEAPTPEAAQAATDESVAASDQTTEATGDAAATDTDSE